MEEKTVSGILLPSSSKSKSQSGEVISLGPGKKVGTNRLPLSVETDNEVIYLRYAGTEIELDGLDHLILKEDDIIGILETEDVKDLKPSNDRILIKVTIQIKQVYLIASFRMRSSRPESNTKSQSLVERQRCATLSAALLPSWAT